MIPGLLNAGLSGYALDHSDVGGYLSVKALEITRGKELFQRWMELASFTPFLRLHSTNQAEDNHQYDSDEETLEHFTEMSKLFASLAPYRQTLMLEAQKTGLPLVRHLMLHYPDDPEVYGLMQQFMLGPDMIVAPVVKQGAKTVKVYLPQGEWTHLWSKESVSSEGSWVTVDAPIGKPAAYLRNGSEPFELLIP